MRITLKGRVALRLHQEMGWPLAQVAGALNLIQEEAVEIPEFWDTVERMTLGPSGRVEGG